MDQKSFVEGARAFTFWGAYLIDRAHKNQDADADGLISLMTPVIKGFLTETTNNESKEVLNKLIHLAAGSTELVREQAGGRALPVGSGRG